MAARSRWVAATTRTSTLRGTLSPSRRTSPSCSTRSSMPCAASGRSPISSRNTVPPCAALEDARAVAVGAGEGAADVAEQIGEQQGLGERGAVDGHERAGRRAGSRDGRGGRRAPCRCRSRRGSAPAGRRERAGPCDRARRAGPGSRPTSPPELRAPARPCGGVSCFFGLFGRAGSAAAASSEQGDDRPGAAVPRLQPLGGRERRHLAKGSDRLPPPGARRRAGAEEVGVEDQPRRPVGLQRASAAQSRAGGDRRPAARSQRARTECRRPRGGRLRESPGVGPEGGPLLGLQLRRAAAAGTRASSAAASSGRPSQPRARAASRPSSARASECPGAPDPPGRRGRRARAASGRPWRQLEAGPEPGVLRRGRAGCRRAGSRSRTAPGSPARRRAARGAAGSPPGWTGRGWSCADRRSPRPGARRAGRRARPRRGPRLRARPNPSSFHSPAAWRRVSAPAAGAQGAGDAATASAAPSRP